MRNRIILALATLGIIIALAAGLNYLSSTRSVTITYRDSHDVTIVQTVDKKETIIATIAKSGDSVRLPNNTDYILRYKGDNGFADGTKQLNKDTASLDISADYGVAKNAQLMNEALPVVSSLITATYPTANDLFTITSGGIQQRGEWYVVKLVRKGEYSLESDTLRILCHHVSGTWQIVTKPDIILTTIAYPKLPVNILSWANTL